jgi:hypothetical protein
VANEVLKALRQARYVILERLENDVAGGRLGA